MKKFAIAIFAAIAGFAGVANAVTLPEISKDAVAQPGYTIFETGGDSYVDVNISYFKSVAVGTDNCVFTYHNRTDSKVRPNVKVKAYNKYGMEIITCSDSWVFSIKPHDFRTEENWSKFVDLERVFKFSELEVPRSLNEVAYIAVRLER